MFMLCGVNILCYIYNMLCYITCYMLYNVNVRVISTLGPGAQHLLQTHYCAANDQ